MNTREVHVLEEASEDLVSAKAFYTTQETWLGDYFIECMLAELGSLHIYGGIHGRSLGYHRLICKRFPYAIYCEVIGERVHVNAILDMRRRPSWIRKSLSTRRNAKEGKS